MMAKVGSSEQSCRRELKWRPKVDGSKLLHPGMRRPDRRRTLVKYQEVFSRLLIFVHTKESTGMAAPWLPYRKLVRHRMVSRQQGVS